MKAKLMTAMILFLALSLALSGIVSAQIKQITENTHEDIFPQTAGGSVVWQARIDGDWEIFLYNANDNTGPFQITTNTYGDISPQTDGSYVTWAAGSVPYGEIFIYDIAQKKTTPLSSFIPPNIIYDLNVNPKVFNGLVVWVSTPVGDTGLGPGDIFLYDITYNTITNVSALVDPNNNYSDNAFRFDGQQIYWNQEDFLQGSSASYLYDLATGWIYRYYTPEDDEDFVPYLYDLATGEIYPKPEGLTLQDNPRVDGDFMVFTSMIGGDREIVLQDLQDKNGKRNGPITANDIEDSQPSIGGYILAWKGDRGNDAEIYIYEIPHIKLVSPDDGIEFNKKEIPVFDWEFGDDYKFKIQFSTVASFEEGKYTLTFPKSDDAWLDETSITLDKKQASKLKDLSENEDLGPNTYLYWRVLAQDTSGNVEISEARHLVVSLSK